MPHGPAPKDPAQRRRANPAVHEWVATTAIGWQHGPFPECPAEVGEAARAAWSTWMAGWFASHWLPSDLPGLRQVVRLFDAVEHGQFQRMGELRLWSDTYGITPKGQQDRRWQPPADGPVTTPVVTTPIDSRRERLKVI